MCDRGTLQALKDANDRTERAERERDDWHTLADARSAEIVRVMGERDEAVALLREATSDRCVVCHADLQPSMTVPPHCEDCIADYDACCDHEDRVNDFRARLDAALGKGGGKLADEIERFKAIERHRDHLHDCLQRAERERDEARAAILEPGGWEAMYKGQRDRADKAERERDELRQEKATDAWHTGWQEAVRRMQQAERDRDAEAENARLLQDRVQRLTEANLRLVGLLKECREWVEHAADKAMPLGRSNYAVAIKLLARLDAALGKGGAR